VARDRGERLQVRELDVHAGGPKKYLIVTIKTIDFADSTGCRIMRPMDTSYWRLLRLAEIWPVSARV
jgi:hypothetical protein